MPGPYWPCSACNGQGVVSSMSWDGTETEWECPDCKGAGIFDGEGKPVTAEQSTLPCAREGCGQASVGWREDTATGQLLPVCLLHAIDPPTGAIDVIHAVPGTQEGAVSVLSWVPGDPCASCGSRDTGLDLFGVAICRACHRTDYDE